MEYHKVPVYLHSTITEIGDGYAMVKTPDGVIKVDCDAVVNGIGFVPAPVGEKGPHVHRVGDCVAIGNLRTVIWRAWDICMRI
jgi:2-enoate reductase